MPSLLGHFAAQSVARWVPVLYGCDTRAAGLQHAHAVASQECTGASAQLCRSADPARRCMLTRTQTSHARPTGAASWCGQPRSSSGMGGRHACTTACASRRATAAVGTRSGCGHRQPRGGRFHFRRLSLQWFQKSLSRVWTSPGKALAAGLAQRGLIARNGNGVLNSSMYQCVQDGL